MPLAFEFDLQKAASNLKKHGISFAEAISAFNDPFSQTFPDDLHSGNEERWITLGVSSKHRLLFISHQEEDGVIRLIGARKAIQQEKHDYEELKTRG